MSGITELRLSPRMVLDAFYKATLPELSGPPYPNRMADAARAVNEIRYALGDRVAAMVAVAITAGLEDYCTDDRCKEHNRAPLEIINTLAGRSDAAKGLLLHAADEPRESPFEG
jgi:hypothetical protein